MASPSRRPPLALAVLCLLRAGPLHPYGMQRLIKAWGKDQVINVGHRANLYKTIGRLVDDGLIAVRTVQRDQAYPERTVYELTEAGREMGLTWLTEMLGSLRNEYPEFPAALSFAMLIDSSKLADALQSRADRLTAKLGSLSAELTRHGADLPRVTLIESEYQQTLAEAEVQWLDKIVEELRSGKLTWTEDLLRNVGGSHWPEGPGGLGNGAQDRADQVTRPGSAPSSWS